MAERRLHTSSLGHPGRLAYSPYGATQVDEWGWQTGRNHDGRAPRFEQVGPAETWYTASHEADEKPAGRSWHVAQRQKKWLLKNHPEAALGNGLLSDLLIPELTPQMGDDYVPPQHTQLALGEMLDTSMPNNIRGVPLIAMAAGSASDVLRLVRPRLESWQLAHNPDVLLQTYGKDQAQEMLWTRDTGVIRRIKAVVNLRRFEPVRWLVVQRDAGTSVFRPEFQRVPVVSEVFSGHGLQQPSHINPNFLFDIPTRLTGCDSHADASFNPGVKAEPPQLAIVDQGGRWTVWGVSGTRARVQARPQLTLYRCGDIRKGVRPRISQRPSSEPQWHRIAWVGAAPGEIDDDLDDYEGGYTAESSQARAAYPPLQRSSTLLICSRKALRLVDLDADAVLPDLSLLSHDESILDVQVDAGDPRYFYVVTTSTLFIAVLTTTRNRATGQVAKQASILHSCPHLRDAASGDLQLSIAPGPRLPKNRTALVHIYSRDSNWVDVFCVSKSKIYPEEVVCHHERLVCGGAAQSKLQLQTLCSNPVVARASRKELTGDSRLYIDQHIRYYQLFYLGTDLSLTCALGVSSGHGWDREFLPQPDATDTVPKQKQRQLVVRAMASRFVVPDSLSEFRYRIEALRLATDGKPTASPRVARRPFRNLYDHIRAVSFGLLAKYSGSEVDMELQGAAPFDPVYLAVQDALATKRLPLKTMHELIKEMKLPMDVEEASNDWQSEIHQLSDADPSLEVMSLVKPPRFVDDEPTLGKVYSDLADFIEGRNPYSVELGMAPIVMRQMACAVYLSHMGMRYREPGPAIKPSAPQNSRSSPDFDASMVDDSFMEDSMLDNSVLEDSILGDSQPSSQISLPFSLTSSQADASGAPSKGKDCLAIIRQLTGTGKMGQGTDSDTWELGKDPAEHKWSVNVKTEVTAGDRKLARAKAREERKMKRKAEFERWKNSASQLTPASQPAPSRGLGSSQPFAGSSQPFAGSSQATPIQQSQPLRGLLHNRLKASVARPSSSQPLPGPFGGVSPFPTASPFGGTPFGGTPFGNTPLGRTKKKQKRRGGF